MSDWLHSQSSEHRRIRDATKRADVDMNEVWEGDRYIVEAEEFYEGWYYYVRDKEEKKCYEVRLHIPQESDYETVHYFVKRGHCPRQPDEKGGGESHGGFHITECEDGWHGYYDATHDECPIEAEKRGYNIYTAFVQGPAGMEEIDVVAKNRKDARRIAEKAIKEFYKEDTRIKKIEKRGPGTFM